MDPINEAIQQLVETKIFSVEGVKAVQRLREDYANLSENYNKQLLQIKDLNNINTLLLDKTVNLESKVNEVKNRELAVEKREKEMTRLEIEKVCADKMIAHTLGMFNTVFANAALKTSIMREVAVPSTYTSNGTSSTGIIKEKVNETEDRQVD